MDDDELHESFYRSEQYKESSTERYARLMAEAVPHGPDEPCTCDGYTVGGEKCVCWPGRVVGCTCDIAWDTAAELQMGML